MVSRWLFFFAGLLVVSVAYGAHRVSPFPKQQLYVGPTQRSFTGTSLRQIAFPLGGIGTGTVSLGGRGNLQDWEIFNRPGKGKDLSFSFFAIFAEPENGQAVAKILERKLPPPYPGGFGTPQSQLSGVARLDEAIFRGEYPFAWIEFKDTELPVKVQLEAWNPFIPLNPEDSGIPVSIFRWKVTNTRDRNVKVSVAGSLFNPIGTDGKDFGGGVLGGNLNEYVEWEKFRGLKMSKPGMEPDSTRFGSMALATTWADLDVQTHWYRGGWWDQAHIFWDDFADDGRVRPLTAAEPSPEHRSDVGSLVLFAEIKPGESVTFPFFLTWHFPNRENYWNSHESVRGRKMRNYYATKFGDAWDAAAYTIKNLGRLEKESRAFHDALFNSTLPSYVLDVVSSQASIIRTNTCMRLADGSFFAFEGCGDESGCCPMNCTHVWNYEQALAYLFPSLERSMRRTDFLHNTLPNGHMAFRTLIPLGDYWWQFKPCADGQMGTIIQAYREWKLSGDDNFLREIWPKVKLALEFAWNGCGDPPPEGFEWTAERMRLPWDPDKDGVMEGEQHNTYDIEFYGPNTMMGALYLGALKACSEMAEAMGEPETSKVYVRLYKNGRKEYDKLLWNGEYYKQIVDLLEGLEVPEHLKTPHLDDCGPTCECKTPPGGRKKALEEKGVVPKYQHGEGCLSDQLLGQYLAHVVGLGHVLDPEHVKKAVKSIFDYNWRNPIGGFSNVQRVYALNDDAGLLLCSWPKGNRPMLPFVYSDEVWTGIEYQVAATLIYNGWIDEGLSIVKGVRDRYDGLRRNPWNEVECGHHYARAMASWAVLLALSGYDYDGVENELAFAPAIDADNFQCFWSTGSAWGTFEQTKAGAKLNVRYGQLALEKLSLKTEQGRAFGEKVLLGGKEIAAEVLTRKDQVAFTFTRPLQISAGQTLAMGTP